MRNRFGWFILIVASLVLMGAADLKAQSMLTTHVRQAVLNGEAQPVGRLAATEQLQLDLVLSVRDEAGLEALLAGLYDPNSPYFRQFLTVEQFTERFGPTQADYDTVVQFAQANGLQVVGGTRHGLDVQVKGAVGSVEQAFHVNIRTYQHPTENRIFYAPDTEPVANLSVSLWHVTGLDNYALPKQRYSQRADGVQSSSVAAMAGGVTPMVATPTANTGSGPSASFYGSDMRAAYYGGTALTGAGQHVALLEFSGANLDDVTTYFKNAGQINTVPISLISADGTSTACNYTAAGGKCDDTEQTLDITQALGMAPGLAGLEVYVGSSDTAILSALTTHSPLASTIGCSWGWGADPTVLDPYFKKMAAQGQSFLAASGDDATWSNTNTAWPADDAYVTSVGGTDLVTTGAAGAWKSETAWADSSGGISTTGTLIPTWQQLPGVITTANKGSLVYRNGPDVAANANWTFYVCSNQQGCTANSYGGTSFAAPMWAGYLALVNQQLAARGSASVGFINPTIYAAGITSSYSTYFHDITSGTAGSNSAIAGYDLVTGWGSPNGQGLINLLTGTASAPTFTLTASPATLSVVQGKSGTATVTSAAVSGFSSAVALTASGQPNGVTVSFSSASIASPGSGSSTMTVAVASTVAAGSYTLTINGAGANATKSTTVVLTVTAAPSFTLTASPTAFSVVQGSKGTSILTATPLNGFTSTVAFTAASGPTGVTLSFSTASGVTTGSATLTATVSSTTPAGVYPITVTGTGGGVTQTATITLTVVSAASFTLVASPATLSVVQNSKNSATISTAAVNGFNSAVALSASGQPSGMTVVFSASTVATPGSASMTVAATDGVAAGTYNLTVTGVSGGITKTATVAVVVTAAPNFTLTASPTALSVAQTRSGTVTITPTALSGFNSALTYTASGQPAGVTASFSPASSTPTGSSVLTLATASNAVVGTYTVTVTATGGGLTRTATVALTITPSPSFTLSASPTALSVAQGKSGATTVSSAALYGFNSAVALTASGMPTGVTISFSPASLPTPGTVTTAGTSTMTVSVASTVAAGNYTLTVTGSGGGVTQTASLVLTVTPPPSFILVATPTALSVAQGKSGTVALTATALYGFNSAVTMAASGMPSGVTATFSTSTASNTGGATLTLAVASTVAPATYTITVTGTGGGVTKTTTVALTVTSAPSFTLSVAPAALSIVQGKSGTVVLSAASVNGLNAAIALTATGAPTGVTVSFSPASITGAGSSTMTVAVASTVAPGAYSITVTGTGGDVTKAATVVLTVTGAPSFTLVASPTSLTVVPGKTGTVALITTPLYGFNSAISYTGSGQPSGVTLSFGSQAGTVTNSAAGITVTVASTVLPGTYTLNLTGTGGGVTKTAAVALTVSAPPSFSLAASSSTLSVSQGKTGSITLTTAALSGFTSAVALTASGQPSGMTISFSAASIATPGSATMTVAAASSVVAGSYPLTVTAVGGGLTRTATVVVTVTAPPDFALVATPSVLTVPRNSSASTVITATSTGAFSSPLTLAISTPTGFTPAFSLTSSGALTLTVKALSTVAVGSYNATLTATGGGITHSIVLQLVVK
jgi:subtilase family serine protease